MPRCESAERQQGAQPSRRDPAQHRPRPGWTGPGRAGVPSATRGASAGGEARPRFPPLLPPSAGARRGERAPTPGLGAPRCRRDNVRPCPPPLGPGGGHHGSAHPRLTALGRVLLCPLPRRGAAPRRARALALPVQLLL